MAPPKLPDINAGPNGAPSGLSQSASAPRVGPVLKIKRPEFKRLDISARVQAVGNATGTTVRVKRLGVSASDPNLLSGIRTTEAVKIAAQQREFEELRPSSAQTQTKAQMSSSSRSPDAEATLPAGGVQDITVAWEGASDKASSSSGSQLGATSPTRTLPRPSASSRWNFYALPLEVFDNAPDFEEHTPEEWLDICTKEPGRPQACVVHYKSHKWTMVPCWVHGYDSASKRYLVELADGSPKKVKRLALRFNAEDADNFANRVNTCKARKAWCELQESFIDHINSVEDAKAHPMARNQKERFVRQCMRTAIGSSDDDDGESGPTTKELTLEMEKGNLHNAPGVRELAERVEAHFKNPKGHERTVRELITEINEEYVQAQKFCSIKKRYIHGHGTRVAWVDESDTIYHEVLSSFLPTAIPHNGLVDHLPADRKVPDIVEEMVRLPTLSKNVWAITTEVWKRYDTDIAEHEILDTSRRDVSHGHRVNPNAKPDKGADATEEGRVFLLAEYVEHMERHREFVTSILARRWRDYIISEVSDKMEDHNFFVDVLQKHLKSALHLVLRKFDLILHSQMRWFVENSIAQWVDFVRSFEPTITQPLPPPLLKIKLIAQDEHVVLDPDPDELMQRLTDLIDGVTKVTSAIWKTEHELVPFCSLPELLQFNPLADADGQPCEYKELMEAKQITREVVGRCLQKPLELARQFQEYAYLLTEKVEGLDPLDVEGTRQRVAAYRQAGLEVELLSASVVNVPLFQVHCSEIVQVLSSRAYTLADACLAAVAESIQERAAGILEEWEETHHRILSSPENEEELAKLKEFMAGIDKLVKRPLAARTAEVHKGLDMVADFSYPIEPEVVEKAFQSFAWPIQVQLDIMTSENRLEKEKKEFMERLDRERAEFWVDLTSYKGELTWVKGLSDYSAALQIATRIGNLHDNLMRAKDRVQSFKDRETLFSIEKGDYSELEEIVDEFMPYHALWDAAIEYKHSEEDWRTGTLQSLNASEIETFIDEQFKEAYKMFKAFEDQPAPQSVAQDLRKDIQAFKKNMPVIQALCQEAIQPHHFNELFEIMDITDDMDDGDLTLQRMLDQGVLDHLEAVERISTEAQKQYSLALALKTMKKEWKTMDFGTMPYKNTGTFLLKGTDDIQTMLDDHIIKTQAVRGSPFVKPIEREVKEWEAKLFYIQDLLEQWLMCQRTWLYLEPIFGSDDIIRQMPNEAKKFQTVDKLWRDTLEAVIENPNVIDVSDIEGLLMNFTDANKKLDVIQKGLNDYLETKRLAFPRFFFLSNDELLMILSQTKDPTAVQPHMGKCFEGINRVRFDQNNEIIEAMVSVEGEVVDLHDPVNVTAGDKAGNVEKWLLEVQQSMIKCLTRITGESIEAYARTDRTEWVLQWPGQVVICVDNIFWTKEVSDAIESGKLPEYHKVVCDQLQGLVGLVRGDLSKLARKTLTALVTIDVHNRDEVEKLVKAKLKSSKDFDWIAQLRYYWAPKGTIQMYDTKKPNTVDKCQVSIITSTLLYGFEYLGNSDRLVITPLTDRCYRTLMGAFHLFYGGAPEGPAGTGKTESTKDLAKALAVQCVVFNCSDGLDYLAMGKFFKGLASSGAWCCFDEFNRINLEVLSVIAQQVATICWAIREGKEFFLFEGTELRLIPTCAVNITMNPGYAGRSELPDNLKALFRPCAMMVPDYALIGEIVLYSYGFSTAKPLSVKAVASLRLGSEQLSSQYHYDFGMRALKSILVAAGQLRRKFGSSRPEDILMLSALNDVNLPKFTSNDIPLFLGITGDLFPGVTLPPSDYGKLIAELEGAAKDRGLQPKGSFIHKCTQLWETIMVRHGLMVVGATLSGKTEIENVLAAALAAVADGDLYLPVEMQKMNPKSVKQGQLYGDFDENTHEWTDGILALAVRHASQAEPDRRQWIMLDGPVDAVWIENMNTVLDDNKKLCLNSGEIIKLSPVSTMMFETHDLSHASPATVSRCGMVFMEQVDIGWHVLLESWLERLPDRLKDNCRQIKDLCLANVDMLVEMCLRKIKTPVPVNQNWLVTSLLKTFLSLLKVELPLDEESKDLSSKEKDLKIDNLFWMSVVWSFGCTTDSAGRKVMSEFIRELQMCEDVKEKYDLICNEPSMRPPAKTPFPEKESVYEFFAHGQTNKWELWTKKITSFDIPKTAQVHTIVVPTADTVRSAFLLHTLVGSEYHVLFSGLTGTGKTAVVQTELLRNFDKEKFTNISFAFSAQTTSNQTQDIIDGKLDKRRKGTFGPPLGKRCLIFVDDLNMPAKEKYDAQPPIELLRQWMDTSGWYDRKEGVFRHLIDLNFIAAMGPPGAGKPFITPRYERHYNLIFITPFETESLVRIFESIMKWFLGKFPGNVAGAASTVVKATLDVYEGISSHMRPTPATPHYTFNLRDLSKVHQGICMCDKRSLPGADDLAKCWAHECHRVFFDRLVTKEDCAWFADTIKIVTKEHFKKEWKSLVKVEPQVWCDFMDSKAAYYQECQDPDQLVEVINSLLMDYNTMAKRGMDLVMFMAAAQHVCKIVRVLKTPLGNVLLVGVGGSGRKSLATLGIFVAQMESFSIEITKSYGMNEWHDDIKRLLIRVGGQGKEACFLLADTQIANENFLEETSSLLNNGEVPNLFNVEDKTQILELCTNPAAAAGRHGPAEVMAFFTERCQKNMHIVLALSPIGENFRRRVRMFPSLVNCCTIDWFHEWPDEALQSVANYFLSKVELSDEVMKGVTDVCVQMQKSVFQLTERFEKEVQRHYYVTPTSYLELINAFKDLLGYKRDEVSKMKSRYDVGLEKIVSTENQVSAMQEELEQLKPTLKKTAEDTAALMLVIEQKQREAAVTQETVEKDEAVANQQAEQANAMKTSCQADLDKALPALNAALDALNQLKKGDIVEVKAMKTPPDGVVLVSKALCWCFGVAPKKVTGPDGRTKVDDFWEPAKKVIWGDPKLLERLLGYDKDNIPTDVMTKLKPLEDDPAFEPDAIKKASVAACGICKWVRAMIVYDAVAKVVGPKKEALAGAERDLAAAMSALAEKKAQLKEVQDNVAKLLQDFQAAKQKKDDLQHQYEVCSKRLITAEKLINGLGGEKTRWSQSSVTLGEQYNNLTGDVLISSGIVAYLGPFLARYRIECVQSWIELMKANMVPSSTEFQLRTVIGEEVTIRQWVIDKLPNDQVSIDNALILSKSRRWPLMIDPQLQANKWIRNSNGERLRVLRLSQSNYARILEVAISGGDPVLLENVNEVLDPLLEPLLQKAKFKAGNVLMIRLGDSTIEYSEDFRLYITTKLPNPHYSPETCVQVTLLNFMVTPDGLQDQMLGLLVAKEEPEVEKKRQDLIVESAQSKAQLKEIEDKILELLSASKGNILDDEELINTLDSSKQTSRRIEERVKEQEKTQALVQETRESYVPVAVRASAMFFVIADLSVVEPMYQYSLEWFIDIYALAIKTAEKFERNIAKRLVALQSRFIRLLFEKVCDSLFEKDKLMYSLLLTFKSMEVDHELDFEEKALLLSGGITGAAVRPRPDAPWLVDSSWARLSALEDLGRAPWLNLTEKFAANLDGWKKVFDSNDPVAEPWPGDGFKESLTTLERALMLLAIRTDCTVKGLQDIIQSKLGAEFLEPPSFNLEKVYNDSHSCMPLIFVLSSGADPMAELIRLATKLDMNERKAAVSLGQGQGPKAEAAIQDGKERGMWVILQNCHLAVSWMPKLEAVVEELDPDNVNEAFRLWLSAMPSPAFPVSVLQNGMKMTVEPPKGLKSNLLRAYLSLDESWFESAGSARGDKTMHAFRKMVFGLCFFHALIQERCNYGPLGWNIPYQFSEPDRQISMDQLKMFLEENEVIPYKALNYTAAECNYGGRVTDTHDRRTINFILTDFYCEDILKDSYKFSSSGVYFAPQYSNLSGYIEYIRSLPINQMPEAFGLHANANLSAAIKETMAILSTANSMQPKGGGGDGGKSPEAILAEVSTKFLGDIQQPFDTEAISAKYPVDYHESMNTVLKQETLRFNSMIKRIRATLEDIVKATKGLVVMDATLEEVADGILRNKTPPYWMKVSYPSLKPLSSYVADFCARLHFLSSWVENSHPSTFWLSGFHFTQSFLTGQRQNYSRKFQLPIDTLTWTFHVLKRDDCKAENLATKPEVGCIVYGLFMDGARWDDETGVIAESMPKVLYSDIPHMHWIPCEVDKDTTDMSRMYPSPIYKTSERKGTLSTTGHSTNFVLMCLFPMSRSHTEKYWTKRGVACITQLDD